MAGFSFRQGFRSRDPVAPESATWIGAPVASVGIQGVAFIRATFRPRADRDQRRLSALLFLSMACWSAILTAYEQPVLGPIAAAVWLELAIASFRIAGATGGVTEDMALAVRIAPLLTEVCARLRCAVPGVALRDDNLRIAGIRPLHRQTVLTLSRSLTLRLSDAELRGILAHEIAHLACGDLESTRRNRLWAAVLALAVALSVIVLVPDFLAAVAPPVWAAMWVVASLAVTTALAPSNRHRETRADAIAASVCADPAVVASALEQTAALTAERQRAVFGAAPFSWLLWPVSWRSPSHPTIAQRTARLRGMTTPAVIADLLVPRTVPAPPSALARAGERTAMVGGAGLFLATLLPWMTTTDTSFTYLTYSYAGTYSAGKFATICGLMIALVGLGFARGALARKDRISVATFMLVLSVAAAVVLAVKVNEIGTWYQALGGYETAAPASGIYLAAACVGAAIVGSLIALAGAVSRPGRSPHLAQESPIH
jgi:Zn-dependent protease with chaperone function